MRLAQFSSVRVLSIAAAAGLAAALVTAPTAQAAPASAGAPSGVVTAGPSADAVTALASRLGPRTAGTYLDRSSGRMVVTVTDQAAAREVQRAGAVPKLVARGADQLQAATATLDRTARIPGTSWAVDPVSNQVVVSADSTVTGAKLAQLEAAVARLGDAARIERTAGTLGTFIAGGEAIYAGGGGRCSLGFNVRNSAGTRYFLTAGHCTNISYYWYANSSLTTYLGPRTGSSFPGNDYGIVRHDNSLSKPGMVYLYNGSHQDITSAGDAYVGQSARRSGSTTGVRSGSVTGLNATVNYAEGTVYGLIKTNICAEPGDSGGSLFANTVALGLTSGGSGNCTWGGTTYFQPVKEALSVYGMSVY